MSEPLRSVFFDLDGTLADTAPDLAAALNQLLTQQGRPPLPFEMIRPTVSLGGNAMLSLGFPLDEDSAEFLQLREQFLEIYDQRLHRDSRLFPGMAGVLDAIEQDGLTWGIITNKSSWLTEPLIEVLELSERTACIVCGDTTPHRKPHPAPMLHACRLSNSQPETSVYIGDAQRDIEAGHASGMRTLAAAYGYIESSDNIENWGAEAIMQSAAEILTWIRQHR
ncbi:MAG: HAD-IA family hydrolase [Thiotrichales bacterium]|nr:HAD-IA family hydrolase [Thiotrichales bacterium]